MNFKGQKQLGLRLRQIRKLYGWRPDQAVTVRLPAKKGDGIVLGPRKFVNRVGEALKLLEAKEGSK